MSIILTIYQTKTDFLLVTTVRYIYILQHFTTVQYTEHTVILVHSITLILSKEYIYEAVNTIDIVVQYL